MTRAGAFRVVEVYITALIAAWVLIMPGGQGQITSLRADRLARQLLYYPGTEVELNFVLAVPLKGPQHTVTLGFFLEANYDLPPYNSQDIYIRPLQILEDRFRDPNRGRRQVRSSPVQRATFYRAVELLLESRTGLAGRACVLRGICEASSSPVQHDGLIGELLHVLLTPSSTSENGLLHSDYTAAEGLGRHHADCGAVFPACPSTPLDLISTLLMQPP